MDMNNLTHFCVSWALVGLIWLIQLNHYPSFRFISEENWSEFHKHHTRSISFVVIPLMLSELYFVIRLLIVQQDINSIILFMLILVIWMNTFLQAVPLHNKLAFAKNVSLINKLVQINWVRTILWTVKGIFLLFISLNT